MKQNELGDRIPDLEQRALSWIIERLPYFSPLAYTEILKIDLALKASAELALVCDHACSDRAQGPPGRYRDLASYLWSEVFCAPAVRDYLLTTELGLLTFGFYASLHQCGYEDKQYERQLENILKDGYVPAAERVPSRDLDFLHSLQRLGLLSDRDPFARAYDGCILAKHPSLYPLTIDDVYAITHAIFFVTDFGRVPGCFSSADVAYLRSAIPRLLQYYVRKNNWDLVAELLITLDATGLAGIPEYSEALGLLLATQEADGSFPGPVGDQRQRLWAQGKERDDDADPEWRRFHDNYHTTLVTLIASRGAMRVAASVA